MCSFLSSVQQNVPSAKIFLGGFTAEMNIFNPCTAELLCGSRGSLKIGNAHKSEIPGSAYNLHWLETLDLNTFQFLKIKLLYDQETCEMNSTQDCYYHVTN